MRFYYFCDEYIHGMNEKKITEIDIEAIVRSRAGRNARFIPGFVTRWLKRLIHQDFINTYLRQGYVGVDFCEHCLEYLGVKLDVEGMENMPSDGRYCTFVSNHPLGAIDGVTLGYVIGKRYDGQVKYLVNDLLMNLEGLAPLCVPINKIGKQSRNFPQMVNACFQGQNHVIMFPAGLCSRRMNGEIHDIPWSKTFIKKSVETQRDVVPIYFEGRNSERFYNVAAWCKRLHLPNFAMALLPDEMYRSQGNHYTVHIGKPIPYATFDNSRSAVEWSAWVQDKVYEMRK